MTYEHIVELTDFADDKIRKMPKQRQEKYRDIYGIKRIPGIGLCAVKRDIADGVEYAVNWDNEVFYNKGKGWEKGTLVPPHVEFMMLLSLARLGLGDRRIF